MIKRGLPQEWNIYYMKQCSLLYQQNKVDGLCQYRYKISTLGIKKEFSKLIIGICGKPTTIIIHIGEKLDTFTQRLEKKTECLLLPLLVNIVWEFLVQ